LNNAHVYKKQSLISENECVRIPDGSIEYDAISLDAGVTQEKTPPSDTGSTEKPSDKTGQSENIVTSEASEAPDTSDSNDSETQPVLQKRKKKVSQKNIGDDLLNSGALPRKETLSKIYKVELEELAQSVAEYAYFDALNKKKCELKGCISEVQRLLDELIQAHEDFIEQYTNELKYMAVDIAEKMILEKISVDDSILQKLVLQNIKAVKSSEWISVELSEQLTSLVDFVRKELDKQEYRGRTNVIPIPNEPDICRVTTEDGTTVSTISVQANNMRKAFRKADKG